jgi:cytochrome c oxidase assembly protein subunit 15
MAVVYSDSITILQQESINRKNKRVAYWLIVGVVMIIIQTLLGGITRLSGSGLSITEWDVVTGALPPLNHDAWVKEFAKYQQSPQYQYLNNDFTLSDFKAIFFWEWFHRLWARTLGVVFAIPFIYFLIKKYFNKEMILPFVGMFLLGGLQGAIGWIMVKSGLEGDAIYVRPTKLAIHFVFAMILACYVLWFALKLLIPSGARIVNASLKYIYITIFIVLLFQLVYGALMAGNKAATAAATWPTINGQWIPEGMGRSENGHPLLENKTTIHFIHRGMAYLLGILILVASVMAYKSKSISTTFSKYRWWPLILVGVQIFLGICTVLLSLHIVPNKWGIFETLAETHQLIAMFLLMAIVQQLYLIKEKA